MSSPSGFSAIRTAARNCVYLAVLAFWWRRMIWRKTGRLSVHSETDDSIALTVTARGVAAASHELPIISAR